VKFEFIDLKFLQDPKFLSCKSPYRSWVSTSLF